MPKGKRRRQETKEIPRHRGQNSHLSPISSSSSTSTLALPAQEQDKVPAAHSGKREPQPNVWSALISQQSLQQESLSRSPTASRPDLLVTPGQKSFESSNEGHIITPQQQDNIVQFGAGHTKHLDEVVTESPSTAGGDMLLPFHGNIVAPPGPGSRIVSWGGDWWDRCLSTFGPRPRR